MSRPEPPGRRKAAPGRGKLGHDAGAVAGVGNANLNAARVDADAAGNADLFLAQQPAQIVAQIADHAADHVGAVDFIEQMRAALQIEAEHDGIPAAATTAGREARRRGFARRSCWEGRSGSDQRRGERDGDFPGGKAHHMARLVHYVACHDLAFARSGGVLDRLALGAHFGDGPARLAHPHIGGDFDFDFRNRRWSW